MGTHAGRGLARHARSRLAPPLAEPLPSGSHLFPGSPPDWTVRVLGRLGASRLERNSLYLHLALVVASFRYWLRFLVHPVSGPSLRSARHLDHRGHFGNLGNCVGRFRPSSRANHQGRISGRAGAAHLVPHWVWMERALSAPARRVPAGASARSFRYRPPNAVRSHGLRAGPWRSVLGCAFALYPLL